MELLEENHLKKALALASRSSIPPSGVRLQLSDAVARLRANGEIVTILSSIKHYGEAWASELGVDPQELLVELFERRDWANFIKHTHRLFEYEGLEDKVVVALRNVGGKNARRWRLRFQKLIDEGRVRDPHRVPSGAGPHLPDGAVRLEEDGADEPSRDGADAPGDRPANRSKRLVLRPLRLGHNRSTGQKEQDDDDPYIVSVAARALRERGNEIHEETVKRLKDYLHGLGHAPAEDRLVDTFCMLGDGIAFFEVKSIHEKNELAQIRHAVSQLHEYRYLYDVSASLWVVLSAKPSLQWLVDYLLDDRGFGVLWYENDQFSGPSVERLRRMSSPRPV
ncbi:MAG: hypothetical protein EP329_09935 [Deltaproteobacteria bacterium]|nr:MAG: hypothetical protein EP329_09935 [Deltaproteobacteria bacterium]